MSLNWNLTKVASFKATGVKKVDCNNDSHNAPCTICRKTYDEKLVHDADSKPIPWEVTDGLIWATMALDMGHLDDEKETKEFAVRLAIYQTMFGPFLTYRDDREKGRITTKQVMAHQGLSTNVSKRTRAQWLKRMGEILARDAESKVRRDLAPVEAVEA